MGSHATACKQEDPDTRPKQGVCWPQDGEYKTSKNGNGGNANTGNGSNNSSNGASQGQPAAQSQPAQMADMQQQVIGDVESFSLVVGPSGEVTHCASGGLRNVKNYPHFNQACK